MTIAPLLDGSLQGIMAPERTADARSSKSGDFMQAFSNARDGMKADQKPVKTEGAGAKGKESNNKNAAMDAADRNRSVNENRAQRIRNDQAAQKTSVSDKSDISAEEEVAGTIAANAQALLEDIMTLLGDITAEGLDDALSAIGMDVSGLLNGSAGNLLVAQLYGDGDLASLLADGDLSEMASKLNELIAGAIDDMKELMPGENAERLMGPALNDALKDLGIAKQDPEDISPDTVMAVAAPEEPDPMGQEIGNGGQDDGDYERRDPRRSEKREGPLFEEIRQDQPVFNAEAVQDVNISADEVRSVAEEIRYTTDPQEILDQVADQIKTHVKDDVSSLEMVLHPASLGNVALNLTSKDGSVSAQFTAQSEAVKAALESQLAVLKENLEAAGVKVTEVSVAVGSHAFEQNLEQGNDGQSEAEAREQERLRRATRRIDLGPFGEDGLEELDESEAVTVEMMQADGNRMDHRV